MESHINNYSTKEILLVLCLSIITFLVYSNSLFHQYNLDDKFVVENNEVVQKGFSGLYEIFTTNYIEFAGKGLDYRPLVKASFASEYQIFGENLFIFHLNNILLFVLTVVLLFYCLKQLFPNLNKYSIAGICLIFIAHPLNTEVINSLKNRDHLLSFLFVLSTLYFALKHHRNNKSIQLLFIAITFILALMSKINSFPYIFLIPMLLYCINWKLNAQIYKVFGILILTSIIYYTTVSLGIGGYSREMMLIENPISFIDSISDKISMILESCFFYVEKLIYPTNLKSYYGYDALGVLDTWSTKTFVALIVGVLLTGLAIWAIIKKNIFAIPTSLFLVNLFIVSNIVIPVPGMVADRIAFGGMVLAFAIAIVLVLNRIIQNEKTIYLVIFLLFIPLVLTTYSRNSVWKNRHTLFQVDASTNCNSAKVHYLFANELLDKYINSGKNNMAMLAKSKEHFTNAIEILPSYPTANNKMGLILSRYENNPTESIPYFQKAISGNTNFEDAHFNLGATYQNIGQNQNAIKHFTKVLSINPNRTKAIENLNYLTNQYN